MKEKPQYQEQTKAVETIKTIPMVRAGDTGPNAVIANVKPEDVAAAKADGWIEYHAEQ